jgi:hypothetical protein
MDDVESFRKWHKLTLAELLKHSELKRAEFWTKAYAIGDKEWVKENLRTAGIRRMSVYSHNGVYYAMGV